MEIDAAENEVHLREAERVLLYVSEARERAAKSREILRKDGAEPYLIAALEATEEAMRAAHKRLLNSTFFHVADEREGESAGKEQQRLAM
ncbi:MAG: hypothetical protein ACR2NH_04295 [Solirubrobacteraceae bacterium]